MKRKNTLFMLIAISTLAQVTHTYGAAAGLPDTHPDVQLYLKPSPGKNTRGTLAHLTFAQKVLGLSKKICPLCPTEINYSSFKNHLDADHAGLTFTTYFEYNEEKVTKKDEQKAFTHYITTNLQNGKAMIRTTEGSHDAITFKHHFNFDDNTNKRVVMKFSNPTAPEKIAARANIHDARTQSGAQQHDRIFLHGYFYGTRPPFNQILRRRELKAELTVLKRLLEKCTLELTDAPSFNIPGQYHVAADTQVIIDKLTALIQQCKDELQKRIPTEQRRIISAQAAFLKSIIGQTCDHAGHTVTQNETRLCLMKLKNGRAKLNKSWFNQPTQRHYINKTKAEIRAIIDTRITECESALEKFKADAQKVEYDFDPAYVALVQAAQQQEQEKIAREIKAAQAVLATPKVKDFLAQTKAKTAKRKATDQTV